MHRILALPYDALEAIIVDDGSTDASASIIAAVAAEDQRVQSVRRILRGGKTAAVSDGIAVANGEIIVFQDADLEYDPAEIPRLIGPIARGAADVVYGSRFRDRSSREPWPVWHYWGNRLITFLSNRFTHWRLSDVETCYKAFRSPVLKELSLTSKGFGMEIEVTAMASLTSASFLEVPISYSPRNKQEGKKIGFTDGLWAIYYVLYYNLVAPWLPPTRQYIRAVDAALARTIDKVEDKSDAEKRPIEYGMSP